MSIYDVLTTGQMIDQLERGEIGECVQGDNKGAKVYYSKAPGAHDKLLLEHSITHIQEVFNICDYHKKSFWIIKPNYVSLDEAMKALKQGKTVTYKGNDGDYNFNDSITCAEAYRNAIRFTNLEGHSLFQLYEGKWEIEE